MSFVILLQNLLEAFKPLFFSLGHTPQGFGGLVPPRLIFDVLSLPIDERKQLGHVC